MPGYQPLHRYEHFNVSVYCLVSVLGTGNNNFYTFYTVHCNVIFKENTTEFTNNIYFLNLWLAVTEHSNSTICVYVQDITYSCVIQIQTIVLYVRD
jgi:hypothetical protein